MSPPLLEVVRLTRMFGGLAAVRDVSFRVQSGEILGLIGPNGAGKTTLFSMITGALTPTRGQLLYRGQDITRVPVFRRVSLGIVRTHQIPRPFRSLTVLENVLSAIYFGRRDSSPAAHQDAYHILQLLGLDTLATASPANLSVGNQKRLELARALATRPTLLLLDEICGGLTESETKSILQLIRQLRDEQGITIIYVEHNMRAVMSVSDRVLALDAGQVIAEGTPAEIQRHPAVIEAYLGRTLETGNTA